MEKYAKKSQNTSRVLDNKPKACRQAPLSKILQAYKEGTLGRQFVQRKKYNSIKNSPDVVQRVIYPNMPALIAGIWPAGAGVAPNMAGFSSTSQELIADGSQQLLRTDIVQVLNLGRISEVGINPTGTPPYTINFDPTQGNANFLLSCIIHELIHVSNQENYRRNGIPDTNFYNVNFPPGLAIPAGVIREIESQRPVLEQNLLDAESVVNDDAVINVRLKAHISDRLHYGEAMAMTEYDTVIADILTYLELNGINQGGTFNFMSRLTKESMNRRLINPWWGTKSARRVDRNKKAWQIWKW